MAKIFINRTYVSVMAVVLSILMILTAIAAVISLTKANTGITYKIIYSDGKYSESNINTGLFDDFELENVAHTVSDTLILPGNTFAENVGGQSLNYAGIDGETFSFGDGSYYSFTGWKIKDAADKIPGETVFQPGDVIIPRILEEYASDGTLELEALWGKCFFVRNPYTNMVYTLTGSDNGEAIYELNTTESTGATGALDTNSGNSQDAPKATIDGVYEAIRNELGETVEEQKNHHSVLDAYSRVVMLVGELDYYTDSNQSQTKYYGYSINPGNNNWVPVSATYKSLGNASHIYNYKPRNYSNTVYGNIRFDNVNFLQKKDKWVTNGSSQDNGIEFPLSHHSSTQDKSYVEITARFNRSIPSGRNSAISTFRPGDATYVVVNGGSINGMQNQYSNGITTGKQLYWTIGRNAKISNLHCGTTTSYVNSVQNVYYNYNVNIVGGKIDNVFGGNNGINTISAGVRHFYLYGNRESSTEYNPEIPNFYGGSS